MSETPSDEQTTNERSGSGFWRIRPTVTDLVLAGGFVLANVYWWRREQTIRAGFRTTREWRREAVTGAESRVDDESAGDLPARDALREAAELVNAAPADLPDRVETLDDKVRALTRETEHLRERWAAAWWQGRETQRIDGCRVVATTLPDAERSADSIRDELCDATGLTREEILVDTLQMAKTRTYDVPVHNGETVEPLDDLSSLPEALQQALQQQNMTRIYADPTDVDAVADAAASLD